MALPVRGPVHVVGATGRTGQALIRRLLSLSLEVVAVARDRAKFAASGLGCPVAFADLTSPDELAIALADARTIVSCAHARHAGAILEAAPVATKFVFLGSTRKFTRWPDDHARGVQLGEAAFQRSGRAGVMLHPTMIYGATGENNVKRLGLLLRRLRVAPLPNGGRSLVQPIHQDDVVTAVVAALELEWMEPQTLVIAGPSAMTYRDFCRAVAKAAGVGSIGVLPVPLSLLITLAPLTQLAPFLPDVSAEELRRLAEDKAFEISAMRAVLGFEPIDLASGLARTFA